MATVMGIVGGSKEDKVKKEGQTAQMSHIEVDAAGEQETKARDSAFNAQQDLDARLKQLENSPAIQNLEKLLQEMGSGPSAERIASSNKFASDMFAGQQTALNQSMDDQRVQYANQAAQMGRSSADPILAAKLAQEQVRQQARLSSEQGSFAANEAMNGASRQFGQQLSGLTGLSQNAIQNRQAVFSLGSEFANTQMNYRLQTARRYGSGTSTEVGTSGGGLKGAMTGGMAGMSTDASIMQSIMSMSGSDERIKTEVQESDGYVIDALNKLKAYTYKYRESKYGEGKRVGVMAQDLEKSYVGKLIVTEDKQGIKHIDDKKAISFLLAAVAELSKKLDQVSSASYARSL